MEKTEHSVISCGAQDNLGLQLGENANVELFATGERLWGEVAGMKSGCFVAIWLPALREGDYKRILGEVPEVTVRTKCDGCYLCGFRSRVTRCQSYPYPLLFLSYPEKFEKMNLRKAKRVECFQPVRVEVAGHTFRGAFRDLSKGGGRVSIIPRKDENLDVLETGAQVVFRFKVDEGGKLAKGLGVIRSCYRCGHKVSVGLQFLQFEDGSAGLVNKVMESFNL